METSGRERTQTPGKRSPPAMKPGFISPVEGLVLLGVLGGFLYSVTTLFREKETFTTLFETEPASGGLAVASGAGDSGERVPASDDAGQGESLERDPANTGTLLKQLDFRCDLSGESATQAGKIRLSGPFCASGGGASSDYPLKTAIINEANQFSATVFMDASIHKFSTDYIPLANGANPISIEFRYANGASVKKTFVLQRK